jgi:Protein of unknown function (DUF1153)
MSNLICCQKGRRKLAAWVSFSQIFDSIGDLGCSCFYPGTGAIAATRRKKWRRSPASRYHNFEQPYSYAACAMPKLPPPDVRRWTYNRKAAIVTAVANGVLTSQEACSRYQLSEEEILSWQQAFGILWAAGFARDRSTAIPRHPFAPQEQVQPYKSR